MRARASRPRSRSSSLPFPAQCRLAGLPVPEVEYRFAPPRLWRLDFAWPGPGICLEVQGGLFVGGRHVRGGALVKEQEKLNALALRGWCVFYCQPRDLENGAALRLIEEVFRP